MSESAPKRLKTSTITTTLNAETITKLREYHQKLHKELYEHELRFWLNHSLDRQNGGYFNCLNHDGRVFDRTKHVWLQCRFSFFFSFSFSFKILI